MRKAGVLGYPVAQSLSPKLHQYWLKRYDIKGEYTAIPAPPEALKATLTSLIGQGFCGVNVTIPHKEKIMALLDEVEDEAKHIGAVNTVVIRNGKCIGKNTDSYGFWENIRPHIRKKNKAVILGAGGAARGVSKALRANGFVEIFITNRTKARATAIASGQVAFTVCDWRNRASMLENADLLVNTTSLGMVGQEPLELDLCLLPKSAVVADIVYKPLITPLLKESAERGNPTVDGLGMLIHQAVPAFEAFFGIRPTVDENVRELLVKSL